MSFAHPLAFLGLLVLPLLVLFYMWRAQHQRQVVSSTWLWTEALARYSHQPARRLPLREPLLLLQLLAALVLTLLLAGPALNRPAHLHRIVVLDGSADMAATDVQPSRFVYAQRRIHALLDGLGSGDTLSLILAGPQARMLGETPGDVDLRSIVDRLPPPVGPADLSGAAALARGLAGTSGRGAPQVVFLAGAQTPALGLTGVPVTTQRIGGPLDDQDISLFTVRCLPGRACQAFARVANMAGSVRADTLAVWADGRLLGQQSLRLPALGSVDLDFAVPAGARVVHLSLLRHDALVADNAAWAIVPAPTPLQALLVSDSPGQLVRALRSVPGLAVRVVATGGYQDSDAAGEDLVIMDGIAPDILPPNPVLLIDPPGDTTLLQVHPAPTYLPITQIDARDPVVAGLDLYHLAITGKSVAVPDWAHMAAGGPHGPVVLHGMLAGQRIALLPWDAGHSGAAQDAVFPLLMAHLVSWLVPATPPSVALGASVGLPANVQSVRDPTGRLLDGPLILATQPGLYRVADSFGAWQSGESLFVVPAASPGDVAAPATTLPPWVAPRPAGTLPLVLWSAVLVLALLALGAEWWFYARKT